MLPAKQAVTLKARIEAYVAESTSPWAPPKPLAKDGRWKHTGPKEVGHQ